MVANKQNSEDDDSMYEVPRLPSPIHFIMPPSTTKPASDLLISSVSNHLSTHLQFTTTCSIQPTCLQSTTIFNLQPASICCHQSTITYHLSPIIVHWILPTIIYTSLSFTQYNYATISSIYHPLSDISYLDST